MNSEYNSPLNPKFNSFSTNVGYGTKEFGESNGLVAKFAFLLLVLFAFIVLLRVGISTISYFLKPPTSPKIINGMVDAKLQLKFPQDPADKGAVTIFRSVNATDGIEFTWSVWVFIDNLQYLEGQYKHIFHKGNDDMNKSGLNYPNNAPGLYIAPKTNALVVKMNTYNVINEDIVIPDIPLNKWVNVIIRCQNTTLDVYINGTIIRSIELNGVPKQNYGDIFVGMNGGFDGYVSNLWYYDYALGTAEINRIAVKGPNTKMVGSTGMNVKNSKYLSMRWYLTGTEDGFNP
jgi:hypothetical protein